jgi:hypothetical protein
MERRMFGGWPRRRRLYASGEIVYWFRPNTTPSGGAPIEIRQCWVGLPLPVRRPRPVEGPESFVARDVLDRRIVKPVDDGIAVDPRDAITALEHYGHAAAAQWWRDLLRSRPDVASFVFRREEGDLLPPQLALMLHPELEEF